MEILLAIIGIVGIVLLAVLYSAFSYGVLTYQFYAWFILPVFPGLPHISFLQAIGIAFFIGLFKGHTVSEYNNNGVTYKAKFGWGDFLSPWIVLLVGYIVHALLF